MAGEKSSTEISFADVGAGRAVAFDPRRLGDLSLNVVHRYLRQHGFGAAATSLEAAVRESETTWARCGTARSSLASQSLSRSSSHGRPISSTASPASAACTHTRCVCP